MRPSIKKCYFARNFHSTQAGFHLNRASSICYTSSAANRLAKLLIKLIDLNS